jgi:hypothetical protein
MTYFVFKAMTARHVIAQISSDDARFADPKLVGNDKVSRQLVVLAFDYM